MSATAQLLEDAIAASNRAVHFDQAGRQEAAASYFYKVAASLLEKAAQIDSSASTKWLEKAQTYKNRAATLDAIEQTHQKRDVIKCGDKQQLERCYFLLQQGLDADEAGIKDTAVELYTQAVDLAIHYNCSDNDIKNKLKRVALQAIERAEVLKGINKTKTDNITSKHIPQLHRGSSAHLKVAGGNAYTPEEKKVLLHTSKINKIEFVPFMDIDLSEKFQYAIPFSDKDGLLKLSPKQCREFDRWVRPEDICQEPSIIIGNLPDYFSIKQTIVSDCSFVASLAVSALYEKRFGKRLVTSIIYPRTRDKKPMYNPFGKYMIKLHVNGVTRKVIIDDQLPFSRHGQLLCSYSSNRNELWVSLLEKAYMKVMGGYDFPGSNSNIDLHALTGWIPERQPLTSDPTFNRDSLFNTLESRMSSGDVLVTVATGQLSDVEAERSGLVATHAYAVLTVKTLPSGARLLQLKNPWSHLRWKGNYSELDTQHWTTELKRLLDYDPESASQFDNGVFWIDYDSICRFFDVFYLNWNPGLFQYTYCIHQQWSAGIGPVKDAYNIGSNPQFSLDIDQSVSSGAVWILLTRHITDIADFRDNKEYITLLVYKGSGKRIYYPHDPPPYIDGVRINSPHYLCKVILQPGIKKFTLIVSQYEKTQTIYYTLRAYATCPFNLKKIGNPYIHEKTISDSWSERTAGGCGNFSATYRLNPKYRLVINGESKNYVFVELRGPKQYQIGLEVTITSLNDPEITAPFKTEITQPYRSGFVYLELEIPAGEVLITPSTFNPGQVGPFILTAKCSAPIQLLQA